jgi:hypothetical protein
LLNFCLSIKDQAGNHSERERKLDLRLAAFSKKIWPWSESKFIQLIVILALLDFVSTCTFLTYCGDKLGEGGLLAGWALCTGGIPALFLIDVAAVGCLIVFAVYIRSLYSRRGFKGLSRAGFVVLLTPYFIVALAVVYHNIFATLFSYIPAL